MYNLDESKTATVIVYGHDQCAPCREVKGRLERKEVSYIYKNVLTYPEYLKEMLYHSDNQRIFPVVVTPKGTMIGYSATRLTELLDF